MGFFSIRCYFLSAAPEHPDRVICHEVTGNLRLSGDPESKPGGLPAPCGRKGGPCLPDHQSLRVPGIAGGNSPE